MFCDVDEKHVIAAIDAPSIYKVPLYIQKEGLDLAVLNLFNLTSKTINLEDWEYFNKQLEKTHKQETQIAIVGKYTKYSDSYISIVESLKHSGVHNNCRIKIKWIDSETLTTENIEESLNDCSGILIPGGFGDRGINGKILSSAYARKNNIPFLGLCLGLHIACIEFAQNELYLKDANSTEFNEKTPHPIIQYLPGQTNTNKKGASMRLGAYTCQIKKNTLLHKF